MLTSPSPSQQIADILTAATKHVRPNVAQLEGHRERLFNVVRSTAYDRDVFRSALAAEDEIRRMHNWLE